MIAGVAEDDGAAGVRMRLPEPRQPLVEFRARHARLVPVGRADQQRRMHGVHERGPQIAISASAACFCGERLGALRRHHRRLAAQQIAGLRQILVRMDHEQHVGREHGLVVERDVAGLGRAEAEAVTAAADMRRMAEFAVAFSLQHHVDGLADVGHGGAGLGGVEAGVHRGAPPARISRAAPGLPRRARWCGRSARAGRDSSASVRQTMMSPACMRTALRGRHRLVMRAGAHQREIVLGAERLGMPAQFGREIVLGHAGARDLQKPLKAELGNASCFARVRDLGIGLALRGVEDDGVAGCACGSSAVTRLAMPNGMAPRPATPTAALPGVAERGFETRHHIVRRDDLECPGRSRAPARRPRPASPPASPRRRSRARRPTGPSALKPVSTRTGSGFSMKWAPSCSATRRSSLASARPARMAARRSSKVIRTLPNRRRRRGRCRRTVRRAARPS